MSNQLQQLFIPDRIKVGFQERGDTYTKKLAYVIYFDKQGKLRKEKSWEGWRSKKIDPLEFENVPTEGFVLNKGVGGQRYSYGWNARNEYIRVYDPRDFEFEISVANLLFILRECDCSRGKGLEGKFVYGWDGTELVLLPEKSADYQNSKAYTELKSSQVKAKDLIPGATYTTQGQETLIYLGRFEYYTPIITRHPTYSWRDKKSDQRGMTKKHVFWTGRAFDCRDNVKGVATLKSADMTPDYANLVDKYNKSHVGSRVKRLFLKEKDNQAPDEYGHYYSYRDPWAVEEKPGVFVQFNTDRRYYNSNSSNDSIVSTYRCEVKDGFLVCEQYSSRRYRSVQEAEADYRYFGNTIRYEPWVEPNKQRLFAELESGSVFRVVDEELTNQTLEINED